MTWVKGTTTWGAVSSDLTRIICGEMADSTSTTVAGGDKWVREFTRTVTDGVLNSTTTLTSATASFTSADVGAAVIATGIPAGTYIASVTNSTTVVMTAAATATASSVSVQIALDTIRTPAAKDVNTGSISNRCGYFSLLSAGGAFSMGSGSSVCKVTGPYTTDPSTSGFHRWVTRIYVSTANTVSGNYSTAVLTYNVWDADGAALNSTSTTVNSSGVATLANGLQVTVSDPSGTLALNTSWIRGFTSTYMRGIDHWPMWYRASGSATFTVNPPGTQGTDWDIVNLPNAPTTTNWNNITNGVVERSNLFHGLGIKTATGLGSGDLYTLSFPMALAKGRIFASATNGIVSLDVGQARVDTTNGNLIRNSGGVRVTQWIKCATTAASVTATSQIQYWMSVKSDGIFVVLNMDPAATGKMGTGYFGAFTPYESTYDVMPIMFNVDLNDWTSGTLQVSTFYMGTQGNYLSWKRRQDGSEGTRDWQTKWMRAEHMFISAGSHWSGMCPADQASTAVYQQSTVTCLRLAQIGIAGGQVTGATVVIPNAAPTRQNKPTAADGKWWMWGFDFTDSDMGSGTGTGFDETRMMRGYQTSRYYYIPDGGWANGDEVTDSGTSAKYFLCTPDYTGAGGRIASSAGVNWGGVAVLEI